MIWAWPGLAGAVSGVDPVSDFSLGRHGEAPDCPYEGAVDFDRTQRYVSVGADALVMAVVGRTTRRVGVE